MIEVALSAAFAAMILVAFFMAFFLIVVDDRPRVAAACLLSLPVWLFLSVYFGTIPQSS